MFRSVVLAFCLVVFRVAKSAPIEEEIIEPVALNYRCVHQIQDGKDNHKSPILLLHGLSSSLQDWDGTYQVLALNTNRRICMVDLRNHGDSPWSKQSDVAAMTADIEYFLNSMSIKKVNIIGHSLGGKIAAHYTLNNPERVNSVVIEDMRPNNSTTAAFIGVKAFIRFAKEAISKIPEGSSEDEARQFLLDVLKKMLKMLGSNETVGERRAKLFSIVNVNGKWQWKFNIDVVEEALKNNDKFLTESKGLYEGPAMFIYGTKSPFDVAGDKDNIMKLFPNAKFVPVEGAGHGIHGAFSQFEDEVIRFLENVK